MRDRSDMDIIEFLIISVFWGVISMLWYRDILFRLIDPLTFVQCKWLLWGMVFGSVLISAFGTCRYHKTSWNITSCLVIPYGIYTILAYKDFIDGKVKVLFGISLILIFAYVLLVMVRKVKRKNSFGKVLKVRCYKCVHGSQNIIAAGMLFLVLSLGIPVLFGEPIFRSSVTAEKVEGGKGATIADNIDTVLLLQDDLWCELAIEEKLDVLQTIANIEVNYLGLPHELNVCVEDLEEPKLGCYKTNTHTICLDLNHVQYNSAASILDSLAHEAFHGYTECLIAAYESTDDEFKNLKLYDKTVIYAEEYSNYTNGMNDIIGYYTQACEVDAREYAEGAVKDYYYRIYEHLEKENKDE